MPDGVYGLGPGSRAWQCVVGCSPNQPCSKRCWAVGSLGSVTRQMREKHPDRAAFFASVLTPDLQHWNGCVRLDEAHLADPLKWKKPALIATGFHGDWALLDFDDITQVMAMMAVCDEHQFMTLTKRPELILGWAETKDRTPGGKVELEIPGPYAVSEADGVRLASETGYYGKLPLENVHLGCSIMTQADADRMRAAMAELARMGWATHVWREPQIGPIDMAGWEFLKLQIIGGESGKDARPFDIQWARDGIRWGREHGVATFVKQLGARPFSFEKCGTTKRIWPHSPQFPEHSRLENVKGQQTRIFTRLNNRKGADWSEWPEDLRVRQLPAELRPR